MSEVAEFAYIRRVSAQSFYHERFSPPVRVSLVAQCYSYGGPTSAVTLRAAPPLSQVLRRALGQFIVYFERFEALITAHYRAPSILGALVPLHVVRFQVKKYDLVGQGQPQAQLQ